VTSQPQQRMTSYLLGELSESDQASFEREYFTDAMVFASLVQAETALVDDYVRGRLSPRLRKRFEEYYLAHPSRRERVNFAAALTAKIDEIQNDAPARHGDRAGSAWQAVISAVGRGWTLRVSMATGIALLMLATGSLLLQTGRLRRELAETQMAKQAGERRERDLERRLSAERPQASELTNEPQRSQTAVSGAPPASPVAGAPPAAVVSLFLSVRSTRGPDAGATPTLVIPPGTAQVRVQLALGHEEYPSYRISLKSIVGPEILTRQRLKPQTTTSGAALVLIVPADRLAAGDYVLTLSGEGPSRDIDELSKSLFRVERK
jgi:hypothetical protein